MCSFYYVYTAINATKRGEQIKMPSKRARKDSERSVGSNGPQNANLASNATDVCSGK